MFFDVRSPVGIERSYAQLKCSFNRHYVFVRDFVVKVWNCIMLLIICHFTDPCQDPVGIMTQFFPVTWLVSSCWAVGQF